MFNIINHQGNAFQDYSEILLYTHEDNYSQKDIIRENYNSKRSMNLSVHCSTICNSQDIEASSMSINRGIDKKIWYVYIYIHTHTLWTITQLLKRIK